MTRVRIDDANTRSRVAERIRRRREKRLHEMQQFECAIRAAEQSNDQSK